MANNALGMRALTDLSTQMKTVDKDFSNLIKRNLRAGIREAGAGVLEQVKRNASWSSGTGGTKENGRSSIPSATKLSIRYNAKGASVRIIVDHKKAPHARPLELGNRQQFNEVEIASRIAGGARNRRAAIKEGKRVGTGIISGQLLRHPVFHKSAEPGGWAVMPTRPFFFPAITQQGKKIDQRMEAVVIQTARGAGFK